MNGKNVVNLGDPSGATDAIANNILSGSETFQGDINMNNNRIRTLYTASSNNDAINKVVCETTCRKK